MREEIDFEKNEAFFVKGLPLCLKYFEAKYKKAPLTLCMNDRTFAWFNNKKGLFDSLPRARKIRVWNTLLTGIEDAEVAIQLETNRFIIYEMATGIALRDVTQIG